MWKGRAQAAIGAGVVALGVGTVFARLAREALQAEFAVDDGPDDLLTRPDNAPQRLEVPTADGARLNVEVYGDPDGPGAAGTVALPWPADVPDGGRHGFLQSDGLAFGAAVIAAAAHLTVQLDPGRPVLVIGHEELMYLPLRIAEHLAAYGFDTRFQSSTRSPAYVVDDPGYPLRTGFEFPAGEAGETGPRYLYNGWPAGQDAGRTQVVVVMDTAAAVGAGGLTGVLTAAGYDVLVAVVDGPGYDSLTAARSRA